MDTEYRRLTANDTVLGNALNEMFGEVFDMSEYSSQRPGIQYLNELLGRDSFIALVALRAGVVVGGLTAYELPKLEQERSEVYLYDLAVQRNCRRQGIASELIDMLNRVAVASGAYEIFVQADTAPEDEPAIALYSKLGRREEVLHFSIPTKSA